MTSCLTIQLPGFFTLHLIMLQAEQSLGVIVWVMMVSQLMMVILWIDNHGIFNNHSNLFLLYVSFTCNNNVPSQVCIQIEIVCHLLGFVTQYIFIYSPFMAFQSLSQRATLIMLLKCAVGMVCVRDRFTSSWNAC